MSPVLGSDEALLPVLDRSNEMDDWNRAYWYEYWVVPIIITLNNAETGVFGGSATYYVLPEAQP